MSRLVDKVPSGIRRGFRLPSTGYGRQELAEQKSPKPPKALNPLQIPYRSPIDPLWIPYRPASPMK